MSSTSTPLMPLRLEFNAGLVHYDNETGEAWPIQGQGKVQIREYSRDPEMTAINWIPRARAKSAMSPTEQLVLVPGDAKFTQVTECKLGRVIMVQFSSSGVREMWWLQDPVQGDLGMLSPEDELLLAKLDEIANTDFSEEYEGDGDQEAAAEGGSAASTGATGEEKSALADAKTPESHAAASTPAQDDASDAMIVDEPPQRNAQRLSQAVNPDDRAAHVAVASDAQLEALLKHVPEVASSRTELIEVLQSSHFSQALDELGGLVVESPALAREIGISRQPHSVADFLDLLRELYGAHR